MSRWKFRIDADGRECSKCREYKPWSKFALHLTRKTERVARCEDCYKSLRNKRRQPCRIDDSGRECSRCREYKLWTEYGIATQCTRGKSCICRTCKLEKYRQRADACGVKKLRKMMDADGRECSKCREYKPWSEFSKSKTGTRGHQSRCNTCVYVHGYGKREKRKLYRYTDGDVGRPCARCGEYKLWQEFDKSIGGVNGHNQACKECRRKTRAEHTRKAGGKNFVPCRIEEEGRECSRCRRFLPWDKYGKSNGKFRSFCKDCESVYSTAVSRELGYNQRRDFQIDDDGRRCSMCGEKKPWGEFGFSRKGARGRQSYCLLCSRAVTNERSKTYYKIKAKDPQFRMNHVMGSRIRSALQGRKGGRPWEKIVGYSKADAFKWFELRLECGMTWDNYGQGGWHIDHIIPVSFFQFKTDKDVEFRMCFRLENMTPVWSTDEIARAHGSTKTGNLNKHCRIVFTNDEIHRVAMCAYIKGVNKEQMSEQNQESMAA